MDRTLILFLLLSIVKQCATLPSDVYINNNITENVYRNGIVLSCSFNVRDGDKLLSNILARQNSTNGTFGYIAGFDANEKPRLTSFGKLLFANETTVLHFEESNNTFSLTFDNLTCRHEGLYKCVLIVHKNFNPRFIESDVTSISVTVQPTNPVISMLTKDNYSTDQRNNTTDLSTNGDRTKKSTALSSKKDTDEIAFREGDNVTYLCAGDVGRPKGKLVWQKIYSNGRNFNYTNTTSETTSDLCSFEGNSTLTIQLTGVDNQAIIRCIVESEVSTVNMYADSKPLLIHFKVRSPSIALLPNKTVFHEGESVELHCKAFGNPNPSYTWIKGNRSNETIVDEDSFVIENANISDSGFYTCDTSNSIDGIVYSEHLSTYIDIADKPTTSSSATFRPVGSDNTEVIAGFYVGGTVVLVILIAGFTYKCMKRQLVKKNKATDNEVNQKQNDTYMYAETGNRKIKDTDSEDNPQKDDTYADAQEGVYDKPGDRRHIEEKNCEPFDHVDIAKNIKHMSHQPVEYAQVDEIKKLKIKKKHNDTDQATVDTSAEIHERIKVESEERHGKIDENDDPFDVPKIRKLESNKPTESKGSTIMLNCIPKSHEKLMSCGYESVDLDGETPVILSESIGYEHADADIVKQHNEKYLQNQMEEENKMNKSHISHKPVEYATLNETTKLKNIIRQNDTTQEKVDTSAEIHEGIKAESEERSLASSEDTKQKEDIDAETQKGVDERSGRTVDNAEYFDIKMHLESLASSEDTKQKEDIDAETQKGVDERSGRTVDNAEYFDIKMHLESLASSEDNNQKENKNAETRQGINERSRRTVDNAEYFDRTTHLEKQQTKSDPETAIENDQTNSFINQAFDGEDNQEEDAVSAPIRLLDGLQEDEKSNQINDKQSKNDYENVGSTAQPESSNGETFH